MSRNTALYVDDNCEFRIDRVAPIPEPGEQELLVETLYSGANPADTKHATQLGIYPAVLGYDFGGKILKAPLGSRLQIGQIVAGFTPTGIGRPAKYGTHQSFLACPEDMAFCVPSDMPVEHAACMATVSMTAADALYNIFGLPLPQDTLPGEKNSGPILIWGASSSVGVCAVQFARASGAYPILVTASPERHALLTGLGATHCFNYKSPTVSAEIQAALSGAQCGPIKCAFDSVGSPVGGGSAEQLAGCVPETTLLASVVVQKDPKFKMPLATTNRHVVIKIPSSPHPITIPARPADHLRAWSVMLWAVERYGTEFRLPSVEAFQGPAEEALEQVKAIGNSSRGFGKLVLRHPLA
ncbi:hypothetical protein DTO164E3_3091 [Paecilomyces variotii]|nr:hypothetical protein DTO164E3_3091 [Paecilomyces variotii]KAJ9223475.1 hypothetical protein DTO169C6_4282 [Paecilomyces variotii]KAJ9245608.1 hypothetical protein DTO169E5_327 [Paecilomyces variotii]KAJ9315644.1 hypothetical protein DTO271D3_4217 [Paecilomyces variotii]KAJ9406862.1 hypothetical protein DTO045G8_5528 [Paecilomyces variotii]